MSLKVDTPENFEERTICCLVLDDSGSMSGEPIDSLNQGLKDFYKDIENDDKMSDCLEIAIVKFGQGAEVMVDPCLIYDLKIPELKANDYQTDLNQGVREAMRLVEDRKAFYKNENIPYKRPWIILITDGSPTDGDVSALAKEIEEDTKEQKYMFLPIGVDGADMSTLQKISGYIKNNDSRDWEQMKPMSMESAKFGAFFKWLSASMAMVTNASEGEKVNLADPSAWMQGFSVA